MPTRPPASASRRTALWRAALWTLALALAVGGASSALAQPAGGTISGRVFDAETGQPIEGVTVVLDFPETDPNVAPPQFVTQSGPAGDYEFDVVAPGYYGLSFIKSGYRASVIANFEVVAGQDNVADFPMPRVQVDATTGDIMELDAYTVEASVVGDLMNNLELRLESDQSINLMSAEDLSKFAASDVADALKRVAGVNVVEGQFAIIRGLEDRYSSTLYNGAPVPSPDPERQSVQLDLFPSDIVSNIRIEKSFAARSPSNAAGGGVNIETLQYPDEPTFKLALGGGFEERALDQFLRYDTLSPIGISEENDHVFEYDISTLVGGKRELFGRELRFKAVASYEVDFGTRNGFVQRLEPSRPLVIRAPDGAVRFVRSSGGLSKGVLDRPGARWDVDESQRQQQLTWYTSLGYDFDLEGRHRADFSYFHTEAEDETVQDRSNGRVPGFDYDQLLDEEDPLPSDFETQVGSTWLFDWRPDDRDVSEGRQLFYAPVFESRTFDRERALDVYQLNGVHELDEWVEGLELSWIASYAETEQQETTFIARYSFEPVGPIPSRLPARVSDFSDGFYASRSDLVFGSNEIDENQYFARIDLDYEVDLMANLSAAFSGGFWFEQANRSVRSDVPDGLNGDDRVPGVRVFGGGIGSNFSVTGESPVEMGRRIYRGARVDPSVSGRQPATSDTKREVMAYHAEAKLTAFEDLDVIAGLRIENLRIETVNDPFKGFCGIEPVNPDGTCPQGPNVTETFVPGRYLFLDRFDDLEVDNQVLPGPYNDQIIRFPIAEDPDRPGFFNCRTRECILASLRGEINDTFVLPAVAAAYRPWDGWVFRFAYSQTVARPSFRELGYYLSLESGSDEFLVGNPALGTSDVESVDGRVEWTFGDFGDLVAGSVFYKTINEPIESIVLRDPNDADCTGICQLRTFLNTPSTAELIGVELEGRRTFDFMNLVLPDSGLESFFEAISIGGNFTYIDAEVERNPETLRRAGFFFGITNADRDAGLERFERYKRKRRLFGQPEWIANADVTFDQPDWGTRLTVSVFAISEVLDAVGVIEQGNNGFENATLDRYLDKFYQLDVVASQAFAIPSMPGEFTVKASVKNVTDSTRKVIYDQNQTVDDLPERSFKQGRDYSFSLGYTLTY